MAPTLDFLEVGLRNLDWLVQRPWLAQPSGGWCEQWSTAGRARTMAKSVSTAQRSVSPQWPLSSKCHWRQMLSAEWPGFLCPRLAFASICLLSLLHPLLTPNEKVWEDNDVVAHVPRLKARGFDQTLWSGAFIQLPKTACCRSIGAFSATIVLSWFQTFVKWGKRQQTTYHIWCFFIYMPLPTRLEIAWKQRPIWFISVPHFWCLYVFNLLAQ